ncbi:hydroxyphenylacetyl-CoA thioesterase PaaI [Gephyromycinifex aptenodytis]|uniref:hydroxyphenylacetyl-CoA thioesterase PaaI n=1 Tax=Gephyromycinifex aptenodytis TaxID=2716227 RepID=UPI001445BBB2|nr:hydroxyphenylacetyl-CoA thioesterase PaaI [Gephyromycinifex aptenodytis]
MAENVPSPDLSAFGPDLEFVRQMWAEDGASALLGMVALEVGLSDPDPGDDPDRARRLGRSRVRMPITQAMVNGHRIAHGGYIFALADSAFALACNAGGALTVAAGCDITYLEPVRLGDVLLAEARERAVRGRSGITDVTVRRQTDNRVVAEFRGRSRSLPAPS